MAKQGRSLRRAINAKCRDCIYDDAAPASVAVQVEICTSFACPLWDVRPTRTRKAAEPPKLSATVREFFSISDAEAQRILKDPYERP